MLIKTILSQVSNGTIESQEDVESIKTLVTFEDRVAEDVIQWFEHYRACADQQFPDCEGLYKDGDYFTDDLLIYLLDWRREMKTSSTWISVRDYKRLIPKRITIMLENEQCVVSEVI